MNANIIQTENEMYQKLWKDIKIFRNHPRYRMYVKELINKVKNYKKNPRKEELLAKYANIIEPFRKSSNFHSASFEGFFNVTQ